MKQTLLIILAILLLFVSCKKKTESTYVCKEDLICPAVVCVAYWSDLRFAVTDKATGRDLLFGTNPTITAADVKLYTMRAADTMALKIKNEPMQYLLVKKFCSDQCCARTAVEVVQEGKLLIADENKLIRFRY
jgi:hypothetical protein